MSEVNASPASLVELFCTKAAVVGATVHEVSNTKDLIACIMSIAEAKQACEILDAEPQTPKGPLSPNKVPTRLNRIIAAPEIRDVADFSYEDLASACNDKGYMCINSGLRKYLAGIDIGVAVADLGVAASGTCVLNSDNEETRLATMMAEICVLILKKSGIRPDLISIAPDLRDLQNKSTPAYTSFISGPSRTADIERVPAVGVHGPLEQHIILLEG